ncbi:MAG: FadR family transcriptional regulator [Salinarimonadaceae bacterium]|nr:MAG: FadR family transcriptional regulator [Salinarimonadaceae bacterium]
MAQSNIVRANPPLFTPKPRRYRQIAEALRDAILSGYYRPGDRLPTERDLAARYSVSRNCVREALLALEIAGLVSIQVGSGVYVLPPEASLDIPSGGPSVSDVLQARMMFEPEICAAVAVRARPEDLARMRATHASMREPCEDTEVAALAYREFHLGLARASGNPIAMQLMQHVWQATQVAAWVPLRAFLQRPELQPRWRDDHAMILAALDSRHRGRARAAMRAHIEAVFTILDEADLV